MEKPNNNRKDNKKKKKISKRTPEKTLTKTYNSKTEDYKRLSSFEVERVRKLISDTLILDLKNPQALKYVNDRSTIRIGEHYFEKQKSYLRNDKNLLERIGNHKRSGYIAEYFNIIDQIKFVKEKVITAINQAVENHGDIKGIAALAAAFDKLSQTHVVMNMGSPFMDMMIEDLVQRNTGTNSNTMMERRIIVNKNSYGTTQSIPSLLQEAEGHIQRSNSRIPNRDGSTVINDNESDGDEEQIQPDDEPEDHVIPSSSLVLPKVDKQLGRANDAISGGDPTGTDSQGSETSGSISDPTGADPSERVFK